MRRAPLLLLLVPRGGVLPDQQQSQKGRQPVWCQSDLRCEELRALAPRRPSKASLHALQASCRTGGQPRQRHRLAGCPGAGPGEEWDPCGAPLAVPDLVHLWVNRPEEAFPAEEVPSS